MKKLMCCLMLFISIKETVFAQTTITEKTFELRPDYFSRRFLIELEKGNKLQIELRDSRDLARLANIDSILRIYLHDIEVLKDTLSDEITSKRIDYVTDSTGKTKIRIQLYQPKGASFAVESGEVAALKLEQDTVNFNYRVEYTDRHEKKKFSPQVRYYRMSFFVNQLTDLSKYLDGSLNEKIKTLRNNLNGPWVKGKAWRVYLREDATISSKQPKGYFSSPGFHYVFNVAINLQNYKNYFLPSVNLGSVFYVSNPFFKREIGLFWEPNFFFSKNSQGNLQTFRNDFITLTLGHGSVRDNDPKKESYLLAIFSYAYLVNRQGDFFEKHTSRLGGGRITLFGGKTRIEPAIYFNDFFKGVTPALRITEAF